MITSEDPSRESMKPAAALSAKYGDGDSQMDRGKAIQVKSQTTIEKQMLY